RPDLAEASQRPTAAPVAEPKPVATEVKKEQPAALVAPPPAKPAADAEVKERVLALVVEKTGYPKEMLDLDLDLEADLGVDTVKQAEVFASIREIYNIPRDENRKLRDYPTLAHVIRFVLEKRPDLAVATSPFTHKPAEPPVTSQKLTPEAKPEPAVSVATTAPPSEDEVREQVLAIVAEKTGYPKEMLDFDLDLEADLGIDTVKQAEMFASVRGLYNIPRDENRKLRDYPTLAHVFRFVMENRPKVAGATAIAPAPEPQRRLVISEKEPTRELSAAPPTAAAAQPSDEEIKDKVLAIVAEKTGYPKEMLDLDLDLEADLGIDTVKQAEMFASVRATFGIERDPNLKLRDFPTLAHVIQFAHDRRPGATPAATAPQ